MSVGDVTLVFDILVLDMFMLFASHLRYLIGQCLKQISRIVCRYIDIDHSSLSDKRPLISCPIHTGRGVMSLLTLISAAKLLLNYCFNSSFLILVSQPNKTIVKF